MPSNWTKQPQQLSAAAGGFYLNGGSGDSVIQGALTTVPASVGATQGIQDIPGDRLVLGMADALAMSKTSVGTLYGGLYQYMTTFLTATATPTINRLLFWRIASTDDSYTTTPDESGAMGANYWAGVSINTLVSGNSWWMQTAGKVKALFRAVLTGVTPAAGCGVYAAGAGAGADVGTLDVFAGNVANPTFDDVQNMQGAFLGLAETAPANATASVIDIDMKRVRF
jgi:hypothetical protein